MSNNLEKFGKKDASWLREQGFEMVLRGWVASERDADFYDWTVYKKVSKNLEIRLQFNYKKDTWSGWPLFSEAFMQFLDLDSALSSEDCPDAETAFKWTMENVKLLLDAATVVKKSLEEESDKEED